MSDAQNRFDAAAAIGSAGADEVFYAIMAWKGLTTKSKTAKKGMDPVILRYKCKDAKPISVSRYLKTFIYFCPATNTWDIHEVRSGMRIEGGASIPDAVNKVIAVLKEYSDAGKEELFFKQMEVFGSSSAYTETSFDSAMDYLRAGEKEYQKAMAFRMFLEQRKSIGFGPNGHKRSV